MSRIFKDAGLQELFDRDGYVMVDFLDEREVNHLLHVHHSFGDCLQGDFAASLMVPEEQYRKTVHQEVTDIFNEKIAQILVGHRLCSGGYVRKTAMSPESELQIHQDWSFVDEGRFTSLGIWCPLVDVNEQNGCLRLLAGSQRLNTKARGQVTPIPYRNLFSTIDLKYITHIPMKAGQAILQSQQLFHGSCSNLSTHERVAAYAVLVPTDATLLFYYHDLQNRPDKLEVFEVDDDFYARYVPGSFYVDNESVTRYVPGTRPVGLKSLGLIDYEFEPITQERLQRTLSLTRVD